MLFSKIFAAGAVMAASAMAALTPQQIADGIKQVTKLSQDLQGPAQSITFVNAPLILVGEGPFPEIIRGFTQIVSTATTITSEMDGTPKITDQADGQLVFDSFREFVRVHQALLNILIGKAGLLENLPFVGPPVAAVLRSVEAVVDSIAFFLIDTVQGFTADLQDEANSLGATLDLTIQKYQGLQI
ncbi:UVI-1 [Nemania sp. FL0916]|nr:UVI-1 [Nemania sp. FL0916]